MPTTRQINTVRLFTDLGIKIFPQDRNKKPKINKWPTMATCDVDQIAQWSKQFPKCNWAALCGEASDLLVIDIDVKGNENGLESWAAFADGRDVETFTVRTPSGGQHLYFKWDTALDFTKIQDLLSGVEAIGNRQCVTTPGSFYESGTEYVTVKDVNFAAPPPWLVDKINSHEATSSKTQPPKSNGSGKILDGERTQFLLSQAGRLRAQGLERDQLYNKLIEAFDRRCVLDPPLSGGTENKISGIADSYSKYPVASTGYSWTDISNARRFYEVALGRLLYCDPHARWYYYDGKRWAEDRSLQVITVAKGMIRGLYSEIADIYDDKERKAFARGVLSLETKNKIQSMTDLAKDDLSVVPEELDVNPLLLNVANGILDLGNDKVLHHSPDLKITKISTAVFVKNAECPMWLTHLATCFQDDLELITYFQKLVGYSLSGETGEQIFVFVYGAGETGKSTTINIIEKLLGDYAVRTAVETFLQQNNADHPSNIYALAGARFILAQEPGKGRRWNESRIKEMSGERKIAARRMRADWEEIAITGKIWISSNNKPRVDDSSGFWRRIKLLPFDHAVPEDERILDYDKQLWSEESSGILSWALRGYGLWKKEGLRDTPEKVLHAIASYKDDSDVLKEFIENKIEKSPGGRVGAQTLYDAYRKWAEENGLKAFSNKRFPSELEERGCTRTRTQNGIFWLDMVLKWENM